MPLPALLTIQSGINQLRYATLKGIMAAKKKEIRRVAASPPTRSDCAVRAQKPSRRNDRVPRDAPRSRANCATKTRAL